MSGKGRIEPVRSRQDSDSRAKQLMQRSSEPNTPVVASAIHLILWALAATRCCVKRAWLDARRGKEPRGQAGCTERAGRDGCERDRAGFGDLSDDRTQGDERAMGNSVE